ASARIVEFDRAGRVAAVGERPDLIPHEAIAGARTDSRADDLWTDLGPMRGAGSHGAGARQIDVTLSAETEAEIDVGATARVPFQLELTAERMPLAMSQPAVATSDEPIVVS